MKIKNLNKIIQIHENSEIQLKNIFNEDLLKIKVKESSELLNSKMVNLLNEEELYLINRKNTQDNSNLLMQIN